MFKPEIMAEGAADFILARLELNWLGELGAVVDSIELAGAVMGEEGRLPREKLFKLLLIGVLDTSEVANRVGLGISGEFSGKGITVIPMCTVLFPASARVVKLSGAVAVESRAIPLRVFLLLNSEADMDAIPDSIPVGTMGAWGVGAVDVTSDGTLEFKVDSWIETEETSLKEDDANSFKDLLVISIVDAETEAELNPVEDGTGATGATISGETDVLDVEESSEVDAEPDSKVESDFRVIDVDPEVESSPGAELDWSSVGVGSRGSGPFGRSEVVRCSDMPEDAEVLKNCCEAPALMLGASSGDKSVEIPKTVEGGIWRLIESREFRDGICDVIGRL